VDRCPLHLGLIGLATGTLIGLVLVGGAFLTPLPVNGLMILTGAGVLLAATHDLAHWAVGRAVGIDFTELFIARPSRPQPGIKIDYATYLRTPARAPGCMPPAHSSRRWSPCAHPARHCRPDTALSRARLGPSRGGSSRDRRVLLDEVIRLEAVQARDAEQSHRVTRSDDSRRQSHRAFRGEITPLVQE
jgi:hypothetical protein